MGGGRIRSQRVGEAASCAKRGDECVDDGWEAGMLSAAGGAMSIFMVKVRDSVTSGAVGDDGERPMSSSELALLDAVDDATDGLRVGLSLEAPALRFTLFGPRILRSGAYSH